MANVPLFEVWSDRYSVKGYLGETAEKRDGARMGFSEAISHTCVACPVYCSSAI